MSGPNEDAPSAYLAVTNNSKETIIAAFHGDEYEWSPGETLRLSYDAAKHIFGFGLEDKAPAFHRLGWLNTRPDCQMKDAEARLRNIGFAPVKQEFIPQPDAPLPRQRAGRKEKVSGSARSLAPSEDSTGEAETSPAAPDADDETF